MFNLEQSIAEWRRQMLTAGIKTPVPLEELEIHLREEIERQMESGLSEQKAFAIAAGKIGQTNLLKQEFQKIQPADKMQRQKQAAKILSVLIFGFYSLVITCLLLKNDLAFNERLSGFASVATLLISSGASCPGFSRSSPVKPPSPQLGLSGAFRAWVGCSLLPVLFCPGATSRKGNCWRPFCGRLCQ